jgi:hypothetical protein
MFFQAPVFPSKNIIDMIEVEGKYKKPCAILVYSIER